MSEHPLSSHLAINLRKLRAERQLTQRQLAERCGVPRATLASIEAGGGNPTLNLLGALVSGLQISIEELIGPPRQDVQHFSKGFGRQVSKQGARMAPLVPESLPGLEVSRIELAPRGHLVGVPHKAGTREYLTCEHGAITLVLGGATYPLTTGEALAFRGDQRHSYQNLDAQEPCVAVSVVCFGA